MSRRLDDTAEEHSNSDSWRSFTSYIIIGFSLFLGYCAYSNNSKQLSLEPNRPVQENKDVERMIAYDLPYGKR